MVTKPLTLALTLGATTAVFSIVDGVLLKPLAYRESDRLVAIREIWREFAERYPVLPVNERHFDYWQTHAKSFESLAQYITMPANLTGRGDAAQVTIVHASGSLFDALRVPASIGRTLTRADERPAAPDVVVVTDRLWRERLGSDARLVGRSLVLDGKPYVVVGILPPRLWLPRGHTKTDIDREAPLMVYMPCWYRPRPTPSLVVRTAVDPASVTSGVRDAIRRIDPEIAIAHARPMQDIVDSALGGRRYQVRLFVALGALALLIATIGVYGVTAYGVSRRRREMNVRVALGASTSNVLRLVLRQGLVAIGVGLAAGLAGAIAASTAVASLLFGVHARDPIVISAVVGIVGIVGVAAAAIAARNGLAVDPASALREE